MWKQRRVLRLKSLDLLMINVYFNAHVFIITYALMSSLDPLNQNGIVLSMRHEMFTTSLWTSLKSS